MNKTIAINLAGFVFNIEEEAYERLKEYLDKIRNNFGNQEERDEIMDDIELRIAELFQEKIGINKEVITQNDITEIISILGHPEDFITEEDEGFESTETKTEETETTIRKRLFRDTDNSMLGGVCSGLGHYFDVDASIIRISFVLLFILAGTGILLYVILLIVVPEAKTTSDKIEMKGKSVNVESIKAHFTTIKQNVSDTAKRSHIRENIRGTFDRGIRAGHTFFQVLAKVIGVGFTVFGIIAFVFMILLLFGDTGILPFIGEDRIQNIPTLIEVIYPGEKPSNMIFISLLFVLFIPIIALIATGLRVLFNFKQNMKALAWGFSIIWTFALCVLFFFSIELITDFKSDKTVSYPIPFENKDTNAVFIDVLPDDQFSDHIDPYDLWSESELIKTDNEFIYFGWSEIHVETMTDTGDFHIMIEKHSMGGSVKEAIEKINNIECPVKVEANRIYISPYFKIPKADKLRGQSVKLKILVPNNKSVTFGQNIKRAWRNAYYEGDRWLIFRPGATWYNRHGIFSDFAKDVNETETYRIN